MCLLCVFFGRASEVLRNSRIAGSATKQVPAGSIEEDPATIIGKPLQFEIGHAKMIVGLVSRICGTKVNKSDWRRQ
jgi:hypothetical protein